MMAHILSCSLCNNVILNEQFDLQKTCTSSSNTLLLIFLQNCIGEELLLMTSYVVCKMCYLLINELDGIKIRAKTLEDKLRNYVYKYMSKSKEQGDKKTANTEECTVCLKQVGSRDFKTHLKTHAELNELDGNFDFDDVNSISGLSPSLDTTALNSEETHEQSSIKLDTIGNGGTKSAAKVKKKKTDKSFTCTECPKTWKTLSELKNHMSSHSNERPYICEICGQAYKRQQALTIHVGMHKGINPFTCIYCKKSFTQKGALARHTPIHTGELPFQCDLCGKRFVHHTSFNIHKLSHSGLKSYRCEVCGLLLMSGSHLKRHMRVHTGEKRFSCSTCGKKFAEKYNLAVHEKLHLGVSKKKKYQCHICEHLYTGQVKLEEHLLNVHQFVKEYSFEVTQLS